MPGSARLVSAMNDGKSGSVAYVNAKPTGSAAPPRYALTPATRRDALGDARARRRARPCARVRPRAMRARRGASSSSAATPARRARIAAASTASASPSSRLLAHAVPRRLALVAAFERDDRHAGGGGRLVRGSGLADHERRARQSTAPIAPRHARTTVRSPRRSANGIARRRPSATFQPSARERPRRSVPGRARRDEIAAPSAGRRGGKRADDVEQKARVRVRVLRGFPEAARAPDRTQRARRRRADRRRGEEIDDDVPGRFGVRRPCVAQALRRRLVAHETAARGRSTRSSSGPYGATCTLLAVPTKTTGAAHGQRHQQREDVADRDDRVVALRAAPRKKAALREREREQARAQVARDVAHVAHRDQAAAGHRAPRADVAHVRRPRRRRRARDDRSRRRARCAQLGARCDRRSRASPWPLLTNSTRFTTARPAAAQREVRDREARRAVVVLQLACAKRSGRTGRRARSARRSTNSGSKSVSWLWPPRMQIDARNAHAPACDRARARRARARPACRRRACVRAYGRDRVPRIEKPPAEDSLPRAARRVLHDQQPEDVDADSAGARRTPATGRTGSSRPLVSSRFVQTSG